MPDWMPWANSLIGALLAGVVTFLFARYWYRKAADKELRSRLAEVERKQGLTDLVSQPIWAAIQAKLVEELTHFHELVTDALLEKLGPPCVITEDELNELEAAMLKRVENLCGTIPPHERDAAVMLIPVTRRVKAEAEAIAAAEAAVELKVVAVVAAPPDTAAEEKPC